MTMWIVWSRADILSGMALILLMLNCFSGFYFAMTGLHAIHVTVGIGIMLVLALLAWLGKFSHGNHNPVEITGLYWHFVDIVWVFIFPLLYLVGHR